MKSSFLEDHLTQQHPLHHKKSSSERSQNSPDAQQRHQGSSSIPERRQTPRETVISEFSEKNTTRPRSSELTTEFTSPPLLPTLLSGVKEVLGNNATPTPIQSLSLKWLLHDHELPKTNADWKQFLLASETGSGKSLAYLLPLLQDLKMSEIDPYSSPPQPSQRPLNPRALILAPTHELSRQLSGFAKAMLHQTKLRVQCASRANLKSTKEHDATSRQMFSQLDSDERAGEFDVRKSSRFPVDVLVGTPMKLLEMIRGRGWDRKEVVEEDIEEDDEKSGPKPRRGRDKMVGFGKWRSKPEIGLANVEWVVVDEADVLFDSDFQETTRQLLADISAARGHPVSLTPSPSFSHSSTEDTTVSTPIPYDYPFNFILTSATIPGSLSTYLDVHHPNMMRLASPRLHHLPKTIKTEYVAWSGGNKNADIEHQIRHVWAQDAASVGAEGSTQKLSKVLVFINKSSKVEELGSYLDEKGIKCVALSSTSEHRKRGSNHHLDGFLRERGDKELSTEDDPLASDPKSDPHVLITTSLLSRGLDFSPSIQNVFIVDEPRNMIDFLHRAGRTGRAGEKGKVVIFGKMSGRGSSKAQEARKRVASLATP
ncbi:hypothetical protein H0H93_007851 [Arthromyces matolae]|nr:hypothetical protein H0H93_007851 [Arthromyces matolae]